jgi:bifunctional DNase/RNase
VKGRRYWTASPSGGAGKSGCVGLLLSLIRLVGKQPIVLLKTAEGNRYLPIWIGHPEAAAILVKLQGADAPRPLTHDLIVNILGELDVEVVRVTVTELRENAFHAYLSELVAAQARGDPLPSLT